MPCEGSSRDQGIDSNVPEPQLQGLEPAFGCNVLVVESHRMTIRQLIIDSSLFDPSYNLLDLNFASNVAEIAIRCFSDPSVQIWRASSPISYVS